MFCEYCMWISCALFFRNVAHDTRFYCCRCQP
jgi:hypothetical protein